MDEYRRSNHSVTKLVVHLVFVTKYRRKVLDTMALDWLQHLFAMVCMELDCRLISADGEADHFHLLVEYPPTISISELVQRLKGRASKQLREARPDIAKRYWRDVLWTPSYFAVSAGGAPLSAIRKYVDNQRG